MGKNRVFKLGEGVTAYLHYQEPELIVKRIDTKPPEPKLYRDSDFQPKRPIMNIVLADATNTDNYKKIFIGQLILHVRFTPEDVENATKAGSVLAYWDGTTWVRFTEEEHEFTLYYDQGKDNEGVGVVKIQHWGDPLIAWGP